MNKSEQHCSLSSSFRGKPPDGTYSGKWVYDEVQFTVRGCLFRASTLMTIDSMDFPVEIVVKNGFAVVSFEPIDDRDSQTDKK